MIWALLWVIVFVMVFAAYMVFAPRRALVMAIVVATGVVVFDMVMMEVHLYG